MKPQVRRVAIAVLVLFTALVLNLNYVQVIEAESLSTKASNRRVGLQEARQPRGSIVVDGKAIAFSKEIDDKFKYLRVYPKGEEYATISGYYSLAAGKDGIEATEDKILSGQDDRLAPGRLSDLFT